ncbi:MAG: alginate export family protein [Ginsengibacter sp.]
MVKTALFLALFSACSPAIFGQISNQRISPSATGTSAVNDSAKKNQVNISAEFRFRTEYRHGYRYLFPKKSADTSGALFNAQRMRLNVEYSNKIIDAYISLQDARVWGEQNQRNGRNVPLYLYEAYVEPHFNSHFSARIGRQKISYDNQRLFSMNDWRNSGSSYDALKLIYSNTKLNTELTTSYNQSGENYFNTNYNPAGFSDYKFLAVHYLKWNPVNYFQLTTINAGDAFQSSRPEESNKTYMRYTSGGRLALSNDAWYFTTSAYYQYGKDSTGKKISAYYMQPEIKYQNGSLSTRLGAEVISGTNRDETITSHSFASLYGSAHRFNGVLDLFTSFPKDVNNAGLINPYLIIDYTNKKWSVGLENHWFFSQKDFYDVTNAKQDHYLGFEMDPRINYTANKYTSVELGGAIAFATESLAVIKYPLKKTPGYYSLRPYFAYLTLQVKLSMLQMKF